jgi:MFS transporter, FHS family, L-fucose permease
MSSVKYFRMHILLALMGMVALFFVHTPWMVFSLIGVLGYAISCVFPVIFGKAIMTRPDKTNDISGLMITGVFGGAVVPPLMGFATEHVGSQVGSLLVITGCVCYLTYLAFNLKMVHK